ncbi:MAG: hypothetical protein OEU98_07235 [Actinomycetota bacterium]|nr:hypothetical protein [Actinomycetota bacterium]
MSIEELDRAPHRAHRRARSAGVMASLLVGALALAGCSTSSDELIATAGGAQSAPSATSSDPSSDDIDEQRLAFAQCMRDNGIPMADPGSESGPGTGFRDLQDVDPDTLDSALQACDSMRPNGGGRNAADLSDADKQSLLDMAQCLRDEGFAVPDPTFDGRGGFLRPGPDSVIDPRDPDFRAALESCSSEIGWTRPGNRGGTTATPDATPATTT